MRGGKVAGMAWDAKLREAARVSKPGCDRLPVEQDGRPEAIIAAEERGRKQRACERDCALAYVSISVSVSGVFLARPAHPLRCVAASRFEGRAG